MDFQVIFERSFIDDLEHVVKCIAEHDPAVALKLGELAISACEHLSFFPERHPRVRLRKDIRRFVIGKHFKVFYRVEINSKTVRILRLWDGRRGLNPSMPT